MKSIENALLYYEIDCGKYPRTMDGLEALKNRKEGEKICKHWGPDPYAKKLPKDAWGRPFIYESDGKSYKLISLGSDKREGGSGFESTYVGFGFICFDSWRLHY